MVGGHLGSVSVCAEEPAQRVGEQASSALRPIGRVGGLGFTEQSCWSRCVIPQSHIRALLVG